LVGTEFALVDFTTSGDTTNDNDDTTISEKLITSDHETSSGHAIKKTSTSVVYILILKRLKDPDINPISFVLLIF
jgi:hypothetical protein